MNKNIEFIIPFTRKQVAVWFSLRFKMVQLPPLVSKDDERFIAEHFMSWEMRKPPFGISIAEYRRQKNARSLNDHTTGTS